MFYNVLAFSVTISSSVVLVIWEKNTARPIPNGVLAQIKGRSGRCLKKSTLKRTYEGFRVLRDSIWYKKYFLLIAPGLHLGTVRHFYTLMPWK